MKSNNSLLQHCTWIALATQEQCSMFVLGSLIGWTLLTVYGDEQNYCCMFGDGTIHVLGMHSTPGSLSCSLGIDSGKEFDDADWSILSNF